MKPIADGYLSPLDEIQGRLSSLHSMLVMISGPGLEAFEDIHDHDKDAYIFICLEYLNRARELIEDLEVVKK